MLALTILLSVWSFAATFTQAVPNGPTILLLSRQISPEWIPAECQGQCSIADDIANSKYNTYELMCTDKVNDDLASCIGCTYRAEQSKDPNFVRQIAMAYDLYYDRCKDNDRPLSTKHDVRAGAANAGDGGSSGSSASPTATSDGSNSGSSSGGSGGSSGNGATTAYVTRGGMAGVMVVALSLLL